MRYPVISTTYQSGNNPARQGQVYLNAHYDGSGTSSSTNITSSNTSRSSNGPVVLRRNKKKQHQNLGTLFCYTHSQQIIVSMGFWSLCKVSIFMV